MIEQTVFNRTIHSGAVFIQRLLVCCVVASLLSWACLAEASQKFKSFELKTLDGATRTLEDYKNKATLVAFFFPSCTYCNQALPETMKIYNKYKDRGLSMVWINVVEDEEKLIPAWLAQHQYNIPVLVGASQKYLLRRYKIQMTPEHYLLNADGEILFKQRGFENGYTEALEANVKKALTQTPKFPFVVHSDLALQNTYDVAYDGGETGCGELLLDLKVFFTGLEQGTVVRIKTYDSGAPRDLEAWCRLRKHTFIGVDTPYVFIKK